jgi:IclR family transcriptional regulator, acetate operon repressor
MPTSAKTPGSGNRVPSVARGAAAEAVSREVDRVRQAREKARSVATVERAVDVLLHFTEVEANTLGVTEVATSLKMSKSAAHRILSSLRRNNLVQLDEATRRYSLGPLAMRLGLSYLGGLDVRQLAAAELHRLSEQTDETATLSLRTGETRIYVDQVVPPREVIMTVSLGVPFPLHAGGSSKAFLAFLTDDEIDAYLVKNLQPLTAATITDPRNLRRELNRIRKRGWAQSFGERQAGAASVAAPVFDHLDRPAAVISVCGPAERFRKEVDACTEELMATTARLSAQMGQAKG